MDYKLFIQELEALSKKHKIAVDVPDFGDILGLIKLEEINSEQGYILLLDNGSHHFSWVDNKKEYIDFIQKANYKNVKVDM